MLSLPPPPLKSRNKSLSRNKNKKHARKGETNQGHASHRGGIATNLATKQRKNPRKQNKDKTRTSVGEDTRCCCYCLRFRPSVRPPSDYYLLCCRESNQINYKADRNHKPLQQQAIDEKRQSRERRDGRKKRRNQKNKREEANKQTKAPLEKGNGEQIETRFRRGI
jgi:hypothetical protein